jgi:hypothetical protein
VRQRFDHRYEQIVFLMSFTHLCTSLISVSYSFMTLAILSSMFFTLFSMQYTPVFMSLTSQGPHSPIYEFSDHTLEADFPIWL